MDEVVTSHRHCAVKYGVERFGIGNRLSIRNERDVGGRRLACAA